MLDRRYWLFKSEPYSYAFSDLMREDNQTAEWDGVRNYQARNFLRDEVKISDGVLFYHSNIKPPSIVGTAIVVKDGYPDHTAWNPDADHPDPKSTPENPIWFMVDIKAESTLAKEVTLQEIKATQALQEMSLFKRPRLSIHPVTKAEWTLILEMGAALRKPQ